VVRRRLTKHGKKEERKAIQKCRLFLYIPKSLMNIAKLIPVITVALLAACKSTVPQSESLLEEHVSSAGEISSSSITELIPESSSSFSSSSSAIVLPIAWDTLTLDDDIDFGDTCIIWGRLFCWNYDELQKDSLLNFRIAEYSLLSSLYHALHYGASVYFQESCGGTFLISACEVLYKDNKLQLNASSAGSVVTISVTITKGLATIQEKINYSQKELFDRICSYHKEDPKIEHVECIEKTITPYMKYRTITFNIKNNFSDNDLKILADELDKEACDTWHGELSRSQCYFGNGEN